MKYGSFNFNQYDSMEEISHDLSLLWSHIIEKELEVPRNEFKEWGAGLIIPDSYFKPHVVALLNILLKYMDFKLAFVLQVTWKFVISL